MIDFPSFVWALGELFFEKTRTEGCLEKNKKERDVSRFEALIECDTEKISFLLNG